MDRKPFRILAAAGSLRQGSYNRGLLRTAQEVAPEWVEVRFFDIGQLPFFNEDVEAAGAPEPVRRFKDAIAASNAVLMAPAEYNGAVPGVLANAIDWASRPSGRSVLRNKPVAVMGQSWAHRARRTHRPPCGECSVASVPSWSPTHRCWCHMPPDSSTSRWTCAMKVCARRSATWWMRWRTGVGVCSPKNPSACSQRLARSSGSKDGNRTQCCLLLPHHFEHEAVLA